MTAINNITNQTLLTSTNIGGGGEKRVLWGERERKTGVVGRSKNGCYGEDREKRVL